MMARERENERENESARERERESANEKVSERDRWGQHYLESVAASYKREKEQKVKKSS